jgi:hypothetical protein
MQRAEWEIIQTLAGPLAEARYLNRGRSPGGVIRGDSLDLQQVQELLACLGNGRATDLSLWMFCDQTRRILRERRTWGVLCELAAKLIETDFVSAEDAEALFEARRVPQIPKAVWIGKQS